MSVREQHPRELTRVLLASAWVVSAKVITAGKYGVAISFLIHWRKKKICGYCGRRTPAREICLSDEKKSRFSFPWSWLRSTKLERHTRQQPGFMFRPDFIRSKNCMPHFQPGSTHSRPSPPCWHTKSLLKPPQD